MRSTQQNNIIPAATPATMDLALSVSLITKLRMLAGIFEKDKHFKQAEFS